MLLPKHRFRRRTVVVAAALTGLGLTAAVAAQPAVAVDRQVVPVAADHWPCEMEMEIAPFSDRGGRYRLQSVEIELWTALEAEVTAENDDVDPAPTFMVYHAGFVAARVEGVLAFDLFTRMHFTSGVAGTDGVPGSGPDFWDFGLTLAEPVATAETVEYAEAFVGDEPCSALVVIDGDFDVFGTPLATVTVDAMDVQGELVVSYRYETACAADVDRGGLVDVTDLLWVLAEWQRCGDTPADVDFDGCVGIDDLLAVLDAWGEDCLDD